MPFFRQLLAQCVRQLQTEQARLFGIWLGLVIASLVITIGVIGIYQTRQPTSLAPLTFPSPSPQQGSPLPSPSQLPATPTPTETTTQPANLLDPIPDQTVLSIPVHYFQTFNNCGPATLAMTLSYFEINRTQQELGNELRPFQNAAGDNDDKSVTLEELAAKGEELGLVAYHRPMGDIELLQQLTAHGLPVITRTWTQPDEDIGHYRVVKGYDQTQRVIIQDDSLQGRDLSFPYPEFLTMWEKFNYEYLVLARPDQTATAEAILGPTVDENTAWRLAADHARQQLVGNPNDIYARFNLSVALYHLGDYGGSIAAFEAVEDQLPARTLWYQIEPLLAYQQLEQYDQVLPRIETILNNGNRAFSELYYLRGQIYLDQGQTEAARQEFEQAVFYNQNFEPAREALEGLES